MPTNISKNILTIHYPINNSFSVLTKHNISKDENSYIITLHFYTPIYILISLCNSIPEREDEVVNILGLRIKQFNRLYANNGKI